MTYTPVDRAGRERSLSAIAAEIHTSWTEPWYAAVPYIEAMRHMSTIAAGYGREDGDRIVLSFLESASRWRGPTARRIKTELREMLKKETGR